MKKLVFITALIVPTMVLAGIFGVSNYEECVTDIVKQGNTNIQSARLSCREQFPKLDKLSKGKKVSLFCEDIDSQKETYKFNYDGSNIKLQQLAEIKFKVQSINKLGITFTADGRSRDDETPVKFFGKINSQSGLGSITVTHQKKKLPDITYSFNCTEE